MNVKSIGLVAFHVNHPQQAPLSQHGNGDLAANGGVDGDVIGVGLHVGHSLRLACGEGPPNHALFDGKSLPGQRGEYSRCGGDPPMPPVVGQQADIHIGPAGQLDDRFQRQARYGLRLNLTAHSAEHSVQCELAVDHAALSVEDLRIVQSQGDLVGGSLDQAQVSLAKMPRLRMKKHKHTQRRLPAQHRHTQRRTPLVKRAGQRQPAGILSSIRDQRRLALACYPAERPSIHKIAYKLRPAGRQLCSVCRDAVDHCASVVEQIHLTRLSIEQPGQGIQGITQGGPHRQLFAGSARHGHQIFEQFLLGAQLSFGPHARCDVQFNVDEVCDCAILAAQRCDGCLFGVQRPVFAAVDHLPLPDFSGQGRLPERIVKSRIVRA